MLGIAGPEPWSLHRAERFGLVREVCLQIDPDGVIQAIEILTPPVGRKVAESIRQLQAFQHVRETKGSEVCPAGWEPGKPTLKFGPALAGMVWEVWKPNE